jgi:hypothetical protein
MVNTKDNGELKKLYAGKDKVRVEVEIRECGDWTRRRHPR